MPRHHPKQEWLFDYATGNMSGAWSAMIAAHLTLCPLCREEIRRLEAIGGALLETVAPQPVGSETAVYTTALLSGQSPVAAQNDNVAADPRALFDPMLPKPLFDLVGCAYDDLAFRSLLPGVEAYDLPKTEDCARGAVRLLRIAPGASVPQHTHHGDEATLILRGAYRDATGHYGVGDMAVADDTIDHKPVAEPGEICLCFTVSDAPMHLTGPVGRFLNFLPRV